MKKTLAQMLRRSARTAKGIRFIDSSSRERWCGYDELLETALAHLGFLQANGIHASSEVVFQVEDRKTTIILFWACILGGIIPIPLSVGNDDEHRLKLFKIWGTLKDPHLVADDAAFARLDAFAAGEPSLAKLKTQIHASTLSSEAMLKHTSPGDEHECAPDDLAFVQFSSGSTGTPKGVCLTHANLTANIADLAETLDLVDDDVFLSWLPLSHDMGMIFFHLMPLCKGVDQLQMRTSTFVRQPLLWMSKASQYGASVIGSPNFGYSHTLSQLEKRPDQDWDLSHIKAAVIGAEPISTHLCRDFVRAMSPFGIPQNVMCPGYGLAEASVGASISKPSEPAQYLTLDRTSLDVGSEVRALPSDQDPRAIELAVIAPPLPQCEVRIAGHDAEILPANRVGHIEIKGTNVTRGYYNNQQATSEVMTEDHWLRTGDLGFFKDDSLVITGRTKEIIFVNGENFYPHDIERVLGENIKETQNRVAACGIFDPHDQEDKLVVFVKTREEGHALLRLDRLIRQTVLDQIRLNVHSVIPIAKLPKTTSGKIQRVLLAERYLSGDFDEALKDIDLFKTDYATQTRERLTAGGLSALKDFVLETAQAIAETDSIHPQKPFTEQGFDSLRIAALNTALNEVLSLRMPISTIFDYPYPVALANHLHELLSKGTVKQAHTSNPTRSDEPIAVIGLGCRFPGGADNPDLLWDLLHEGRDAISEVPAEKWNMEDFYDPDPDQPGKIYTKYGGFIKNLDMFDPAFFGISPREATLMDPQQRLMLEVVWESMENAGIHGDSLRESPTGVFMGISVADYREMILESGKMQHLNGHYLVGNTFAASVGRISYTLGLQGPNMAIDTACSSSLVSVHQACQSLRSNECNLAVAGGVNLILSPTGMIILSRARMLAPDGRCKAFDESANGYVRGEGCGAVVLKRMSKAIEDGDTILAVIRGSAVNQDGPSGGFTVPSGLAQQALIKKAWDNAGISASDIDYIEAHGTGTSIGDPIELRALASAMHGRSTKEPALIGSIKTNIGHLEAASGIAALLKIILSLNRERIPKHLHFNTPTSRIEWEELPLEVVAEERSWPRGKRPRIAGVSAFGFSGTNAHMVVEEAPSAPTRTKSDRDAEVITLAAKSEDALRAAADNYSRHLQLNPNQLLEDICFTSHTGRDHYEHRLAIVCEDRDQLCERLDRFCAGKPTPGLSQKRVREQEDQPKIAFLFSGQGSQYPGMGRRLFETQPLFRSTIEKCHEAALTKLDVPLIDMLYGKKHDDLLNQTKYAQPALFALEYALAALWNKWSVTPDLVLGHSVGEYPAACLAGVFSLEQGMELIIERGRLMQEMPATGTMAAALASHKDVTSVLKEVGLAVSIAAVNGPSSCVISGEKKLIAEACTLLKDTKIKTKELQVSHAFHSAMMEPMLDEFLAAAAGVDFSNPAIPIISNVTGSVDSSSIVTAPEYWRDHVRKPVMFNDGICSAHAAGCRIFLEMGPKTTLIGMGKHCISDEQTVWLGSLSDRKNDWESILGSLGELYVNGIPIDWSAYDADSARSKVSLPTYPFQRQSYWVDIDRPSPSSEKSSNIGTPDLTWDLFWKETSALPELVGERGRWLLFADDDIACQQVAKVMKEQGQTLLTVVPGNDFTAEADSQYTINPTNADDMVHLVDNVLESGDIYGVIYMWTQRELWDEEQSADALDRVERVSCGGLINLVKALNSKGVSGLKTWIATKGAMRITPDDTVIAVAQTPLWGVGKVIALEHPELWGGLVDLDPQDRGCEALVNEALFSDNEDQVAYRGGRRYVARLGQAELESKSTPNLSTEGSYLVTGGYGALGLRVAEWLSKLGAQHLVLVGRSGADAQAAERINLMRDRGTLVDEQKADVTSEKDVEELIDHIRTSGLHLRGIVHAAGASDVEALSSLTVERFQQITSAKIKGAWNLHRATRHANLEMFMCFSSISSVWGSSGQAHYSAANAFLDGLVHHRRSMGNAALTVNWGPWGGGGMATEDAQEQLTSMGVRVLDPSECFEVLTRIVSDDRAQTIVADIDWPLFKGLYETKGKGALFSEIEGKTDSEGGMGEETAQLPKELEDCTESEITPIIIAHLQEQVGLVLGMSGAQLPDIEATFADMGVDSFLAIELKNHLQKSTGQSLPATMVFDFPTITALATHIRSLLEPDTEKAHDSEQGQGLADMTSDELAEVLDRELEAYERDDK